RGRDASRVVHGARSPPLFEVDRTLRPSPSESNNRLGVMTWTLAQGPFRNTGPAVFSVASSCATLAAVGEQAWDWSQRVVDHVEVHAGDFDASVRFYTTVLAPLDIPSWSEDSESERIMCFTLVSIVDRQPPTTGLHL